MSMAYSSPMLLCRVTFTYFNNVHKTLRLCLKVVVAHSFWALVALVTALSIPSGVAGLTSPRECPLAGQ